MSDESERTTQPGDNSTADPECNDRRSTSGMEHWTGDVHQGDAAETLAEMPADSVHCVMTSPPYFGLRDYGVNGQIGLEDSVGEFIDSLVNVAEELRRVLRDDGSWWLNLGDSFAGSWGAQSKDETENNLPQHDHPDKNPARNGQLRRKNKMLVPHRVAIALQDAGWIVRSDAVWAKPNPMPHPVKDRLHEHKEFLFHLAPEPDYWFDLDAIREPHKESSLTRTENSFENSGTTADAYPTRESDEHIGTEADQACHPNGKNPGDVLEVTVQPFPEAHFAVYPPELVETPIKATAPEHVCAECGTPYDRVTDTVPMWERDPSTIEREQTKRALEIAEEEGLTDAHFEAARSVGIGNLDASEGNPYDRVDDETEKFAREAAEVLGSYYREALMSESQPTEDWTQQCDCATDETGPGIVLDPFAGAGTTCLVAKRLGRQFVGIDLNPEYIAIAQKRVGLTVDEPERLLEDGEAPITAFTDGGALDR